MHGHIKYHVDMVNATMKAILTNVMTWFQYNILQDVLERKLNVCLINLLDICRECVGTNNVIFNVNLPMQEWPWKTWAEQNKYLNIHHRHTFNWFKHSLSTNCTFLQMNLYHKNVIETCTKTTWLPIPCLSTWYLMWRWALMHGEFHWALKVVRMCMNKSVRC